MNAPEERRRAALAALIGEPAKADAGPGKLLRITEAASRLGYSRTHTHRLIKRGVLRTITPYVGALPRVLESDVATFASGRPAQAEG